MAAAGFSTSDEVQARSSGRKKGRSLSPPGTPRSRKIFSCLKSDGDQDDDGELAQLPLPAPAALPTGATRISCPPIADFTAKLQAAKGDCAGFIRAQHLRQNDELYANFKQFLSDEMASENIDSWEAFVHLEALCKSHDEAAAKQHLAYIDKQFFSVDAPTPVSCTELYEPMQALLQTAPAMPVDDLAAQVSLMTENLEFYSLRDPLMRWTDFHRKKESLSASVA